MTRIWRIGMLSARRRRIIRRRMRRMMRRRTRGADYEDVTDAEDDQAHVEHDQQNDRQLVGRMLGTNARISIMMTTTGTRILSRRA